MAIMKLDKKQGTTEDGRYFGYIHGDNGGFFFTHMDTLEATMDSLEVDAVDGDGGLDIDSVRAFLASRIASDFRQEDE